MEKPHTPARKNHVRVGDFDGTMTRHDFYRPAVEGLLPQGTADYWASYRFVKGVRFSRLKPGPTSQTVCSSETPDMLRPTKIAIPTLVRAKEEFYTVLFGRGLLPEVERIVAEDSRLQPFFSIAGCLNR